MTIILLIGIVIVYEVVNNMQKKDAEEIKRYWEEEDKRYAA